MLSGSALATDTAAETADDIETTNAQRPRIGLVLSGGGARGIAHIGVLRVLEENNVPVDFIVGTSAGSIIGGLYAIGKSPDQIERDIAGIDWNNVFHDFAYREYKTFRRKRDDFDFFNIHRVGISDEGLQLSPGLIEGQQIEIALDRLAYPAFHIKDFDRFSIPYRAVATDIETGKPVIISRGNLARAMRASMSVPGALPPITIDGKLLVDGGIANNIPIGVAREMGADTLIVVDVSEALASKEEIDSSVAITAQLTTIMTRRIADQQLKTLTSDDLLIVANEGNVGAADFDLYEQSIKAGTEAALRQIEAIRRLSLSDEDYRSYRQSLRDVKVMEPIIDFIEIKNSTNIRDEALRLKIHQKLGEPLDVPALERDLSYIYGLDFSDSVVYSLEQRDDKTGLIIYVRDREWANSYLQFGISIKSASNIGSFTNIDAAYVKNDLNDLTGELRATARLGSEPAISGEYYQPVNEDLDTYVSVKAGIDTQSFPTLANGSIDTIERFHRNYLRLALGKTFKQTSQLQLSLQRNAGRTVVISGQPTTPNAHFDEGYVIASLFNDSLDNLSFPNHGFFGGIAYKAGRQSIGDDADYDQVRLIASGAGTYKRYTVFSRAIVETTLDENAPFNAQFRNGGFMKLSGTLDRELAGQHFGLVEAAFYRRLGNIKFLPIYTGFSVETGNVWNRRDEIKANNLRLAGSLFIGADTFIGPLYFAFGSTDNGDRAVYFNLGNTFLAVDH